MLWQGNLIRATTGETIGQRTEGECCAVCYDILPVMTVSRRWQRATAAVALAIAVPTFIWWVLSSTEDREQEHRGTCVVITDHEVGDSKVLLF